MDLLSNASKETNRLAALHRYRILDTMPEREFDRLTQLAATVCNVPVASISLVDEDRQWFKSKVGLDFCETKREHAFCRYTILDTEVFEVEDALLDERFKSNPLVTGEPHIRYYAGVPLTDCDGYNLGTLCVIDQKPGKLGGRELDALKIIARAVTDLIAERRQKQELQYFDQIFSSSKDLICVAGTDGVLKKVNPAFSEVLGWSKEYLLSTLFFDLVHPEDRAVTTQGMNNLSEGLHVVNFSIRFLCKDNKYKIIQWTATPEPGTGYLFAVGRDITSEKEKEVKLFNSEKRFRSFFENSRGLMCTHDLAGTLLDINSAGAGLLGYTPAELFGRNLAEIIHPDYRGNLRGYLEAVKEQHKASGLMHTVHKDGRMAIWLFNNVMEEDDQGNHYIIGNAIDITGRQHLEDSLKKTKEMLEQTNEVARIGTWEMDLDYQTIHWSDMTKIIHGVPEDYVPEYEKGISFYRGRNRESIVNAMKQAIGEGEPFDLEVQIVNAQGKEVWVRTIGKPVLENGRCTRLYGAFQDIDEKKKAEQALLNEKLRLSAFVEHSPVAASMLDTDLRYIAVSKRWREDYHIHQDVIGKSQSEVFPDMAAKWKEICQSALKGQASRGDEERLRFGGLDHDRYLKWEILPWYQYDGSIGGIMAVTEDITVSCIQREELKRAKLNAEQASIAKSEFLANMSHEIRTPLNGVIGFTDLVLKTELSATQQQYLSIANQSANALLAIINDILDFSKIEAGKLELDIERCDLFEISSQAADVVTYQAQKKGLEMLLNIPPDLPRFIWTDAVRIKQVLVNLLGNAVKFTERGEIEMKIVPLSDPAAKYVNLRFEVRDTGIGIKEEKQNKIFDAFSQEDPSTTKRYGGTGLGLTISNKLLEMMGSKLELESKAGQGSRFFFDVRLKAEKGEPLPQKSLEHIRKVLIVDDNENNRLILRQLLRLRNIDSEVATSGFEALQLLAMQNKYDVILMDYHMPFMNGLETIRKIRENFTGGPNDYPVMVLHSSSDDEAMIRICEELNVKCRMVKPVKMQDFYNSLSRLSGEDRGDIEIQKAGQSTVNDNDLTILVAEDNQVNKLLAKTIIARVAPNATVLEADNGEETVALHAQADLILMDIQMPVMNGYEATLKIRESEENRRVPIIALTAGNVKGEKEKCLAVGMDDFVAKPFVEESIAELFRVWLPKSRSNGGLGEGNESQEVESHFTPETIMKYAGNDEGLIREILEVVVAELSDTLKLLEQDRSVAELNALGHKLFGTAATSGMHQLASLARELEYIEEEIIPGPLLDRIRTEIIQARQTVENYISSYS